VKNNLRFSIDFGHLIFLIIISAWVIWYWMNARSVSTSSENLLIIQPVSIGILILAVCILPQCIRSADIPDELKPEPLSTVEFLKIVAVMLAMAGLVYLMFTVGFDVGVLFFSAISTIICGERRPLFVGLFSIVTTLVIVKGYQQLITFPMPNLFL
jgi:cytochrome b561